MRGANAGPRRVVVTGMGCVTPLGHGVAASWRAALAGKSGVATVTRFDTRDHSVKIAAEVPGEIDLGPLTPKQARRLDRGVLMALAAAREAVAEAKLEPSGSRRERVGVAIGSGIGGVSTLIQSCDTLLRKGPRRISPFALPAAISNMASGCVAIEHRLGGPNLCPSTACASGAQAIGQAARMVAWGDADAMLAGGFEAPITALGLAGFAAMRALSSRNEDPCAASRPFDSGRDGFVVAEGAGVLVLEPLEAALARGVPILAEVAGYAATANATHPVHPEAGGAAETRCMRLALEDAGLGPADLDFVSAHATGTPAGDSVEAQALRALLGPLGDRVPVCATKSMTGHLIGAAGALEAIFCVRSFETGWLPPTINLDRPDPECALDHVANKARRVRARVALSNSFGFGGTNVSLVFCAPIDASPQSAAG